MKGVLVFLVVLLSQIVSAIGSSDTYADQWCEQLASDESAKVDQATVKLYLYGARGIPTLIENITNQKQYKGTILTSDLTSMTVKDTQVGLACAYIIDAIARRELFNYELQSFCERKFNKSGLFSREELVSIQARTNRWYNNHLDDFKSGVNYKKAIKSPY